jgi:hypothetical protein
MYSLEVCTFFGGGLELEDNLHVLELERELHSCQRSLPQQCQVMHHVGYCYSHQSEESYLTMKDHVITLW